MVKFDMTKKAALLTLITLFVAFTTPFLSAQNTIRFITKRATAVEDQIYRTHFRDYTIATISTQETSDMLRSENFFDQITLISDKQASVTPQASGVSFFKLSLSQYITNWSSVAAGFIFFAGSI